MKMDASTLRSMILTVVKPLRAAKVLKDASLTTAVNGLAPDNGTLENFRHTSPFGFISRVPKGVTAFYQNLNGSGFESIILGFLHKDRPSPVLDGETILYSTNPDGSTIKVKISLGGDGTLTIDAPVKVVVKSPQIELGSSGLEKILNGEAFQTFFNSHTHIGNLGAPTGPPQEPSTPAHLSATVKAAT